MPPGNVTSHLEELLARVEELERRISVLENHRATDIPVREPSRVKATAAHGPDEAASTQPQPSVFSIFGRAVLGIAGAYLLRAAAESAAFPRWIVVTLALAYAAGWLVGAAWPAPQSRLARLCYAITAALILAPMLWEITVRFRMLEPSVTAAILVAFSLLSMSLAWRRNVSSVIWVGMLASVVTALVLMVGTRALAPFTAALLVMALAVEFAGSRGRWPGLRPVVAVAADFATIILVIILGNIEAVPPEYHPVSASIMIALVVALWTIYAVNLAINSLALRLQIKGLEAAQFFVTALLAGWAVLRITRGAGLFSLGACCLTVGAACYFAAFGLLTRHEERVNFRLYAACGVTFVTAGSFFALPAYAVVIWLCFAALLATWLGVRLHSAALDLHGVVYLIGALSASGLLEYAGCALAGVYAPVPGALPLVGAVTALLSAAIVSRYPGERSGARVLRLLPAILAVYATAGLAVPGLVWLTASGAAPALPRLAVIRTMVTGAAALLLAFVGARRKLLELVWIAYAAAVLGSLKLLFEDLRIGSTQSLAASLLIYGAVLVLIPHLVRTGKRWA